MPLVIHRAEDLPGCVRFVFRAPTDYAIELYPGPGFTGMARIDLKYEGQVVASYEGHDSLGRKLPKVHLEGSEDQHDLARCLEAVKSYAFSRFYREQTEGHGWNSAAKLWQVANAAEYDLQVLRGKLAAKCQNHKLAAKQ